MSPSLNRFVVFILGARGEVGKDLQFDAPVETPILQVHSIEVRSILNHLLQDSIVGHFIEGKLVAVVKKLLVLLRAILAELH